MSFFELGGSVYRDKTKATYLVFPAKDFRYQALVSTVLPNALPGFSADSGWKPTLPGSHFLKK
jgi:hypothetical protein